MKAIERLYEYLRNKGIKPTNFEKDLGLSNGYLSSQKKRNADMGETIIVKITDYCRDLSLTWLLTGEGDMIYSSSPPKSVAREPNSRDQQLIELQTKHIEILEDKVKSLESQVNTLKTAAAHLVPARPNPSEPLPAAVIKQPAGKPNKRESQ